jgi:hypothetical protein
LDQLGNKQGLRRNIRNSQDTQLFVKLLNARVNEAGWVYRLPTQPEWEYACRGGPMDDRFVSSFDFYGDKPMIQLQPDQANIIGKGRTSRWAAIRRIGWDYMICTTVSGNGSTIPSIQTTPCWPRFALFFRGFSVTPTQAAWLRAEGSSDFGLKRVS